MYLNGQLKVDIAVKGDAISANIVAQSQQVIDTLDKNMSRLRDVLENQGFTVDSLKISLQTDSSKQQNLFQENFNSRQQASANSQKSSSKTKAVFETLINSEDIIPEQNLTGVNVTA